MLREWEQDAFHTNSNRQLTPAGGFQQVTRTPSFAKATAGMRVQRHLLRPTSRGNLPLRVRALRFPRAPARAVRGLTVSREGA